MRRFKLIFLYLICTIWTHANAWVVHSVEGEAFISYSSAGDRLERLSEGSELRNGAALVTGEDSRVSLRHNLFGTLLISSLSALQLKAPQSFYLARGACLAALQREGQPYKLEGKLTSVSLKRGTFILEATAVGGLKLLNLARKVNVRGQDGDTTSLRAGELVFARTGDNAFSRKLTIYLRELLSSSRLVAFYKKELCSDTSLDAYAQLQYENLTGLSEAFVGDAVSDENVELFVKEK